VTDGYDAATSPDPGSRTTDVGVPRPVRAVALDFGGVLTTPVRESVDAWLAEDGIRPDSFADVMRAWLGHEAPDGTPVHALETGTMSVAEFEHALAARLVPRDGGRPVRAEGLLTRLFAGMRPEPAMLALVRDLRAAGVATGLLSNSWGNTYPPEVRDGLFDAVVVSGEVGLRKPDPAIFARVLDALGVAASEAAFVDDVRPHVASARSLGMQAHQHESPATTRAWLAARVPGLDPPSGDPSADPPHVPAARAKGVP
jgi:epoxide hydrolase-like predicted phosphatase